MAATRQQEHYGGFYVARSFVRASDRTTLCVPGVRESCCLDRPHKNRNICRLIRRREPIKPGTFENSNAKSESAVLPLNYSPVFPRGRRYKRPIPLTGTS